MVMVESNDHKRKSQAKNPAIEKAEFISSRINEARRLCLSNNSRRDNPIFSY
mgnify:CR=1 FL=1